MIGSLIASLARRVASAYGLSLLPRECHLTQETALARWSRREIGTAIDVGASDGRWTRDALRFFPSARYLLIEAQAAPHREKLEALAEEHANVDFLLAAAGDRDGMLHFDTRDPYGGLASHRPFESGNMEVPAVRIDSVVAANKLPPAYLLKLDTHGFEVPIFEGAARKLEETSPIIVEVYNFTVCDGALRFPELCGYLEARGFRPLDLFAVMHRPGDWALWQFDLVLGRTNDAEFRSNSYE